MIYVDATLSRRLERTEARANVDFVESRARLHPESGAEWIEVGGAYAMFDGVGSPLTQTFGLGIFEDANAAHLDELEKFFSDRGAEIFHEVSPLANQAILALLGGRGYRPIEVTSVMCRDLSNLHFTPTAISSRVIEGGEEDLWAETAAAGWATIDPGLADFMLEFGRIAARTKHSRPFIAEIDGKPVAAGGLIIFDDICILAGASTKPEFRNRGAQNALLSARLDLAKRAGCELAMMCAAPGSQSQKNAQRNGFQIAYTRIKWQLMG